MFESCNRMISKERLKENFECCYIITSWKRKRFRERKLDKHFHEFVPVKSVFHNFRRGRPIEATTPEIRTRHVEITLGNEKTAAIAMVNPRRDRVSIPWTVFSCFSVIHGTLIMSTKHGYTTTYTPKTKDQSKQWGATTESALKKQKIIFFEYLKESKTITWLIAPAHSSALE